MNTKCVSLSEFWSDLVDKIISEITDYDLIRELEQFESLAEVGTLCSEQLEFVTDAGQAGLSVSSLEEVRKDSECASCLAETVLAVDECLGALS